MAKSNRNIAAWTQQAEDRLSRQIANLGQEASSIAETLGRYSARAGHNAGHFIHDVAEDAAHGTAVVASRAGRQAARAGRAVGKDPLPAVAAVAGLACLLSLLLGSRSRR
ncbi:hypothetical protein [Devosia sp.]|uniref:hypothetical protein n=1 Tax=Devosia sp. TaxID=1871048 RepID=UPI003A948059